jgi:hypothetical protein
MRNITLGLCAALALSTTVLAGCGNGDSAGAVSISDNFNDGVKDLEKWGDDVDDTERKAFTERDGKLGLVAGTLRVRFDPITKVLSLFFDVSQADADDWIPFRTISVGDTAAQKSVDWSMTETDFFSISVYGLGVDVEEGTVRADNFTTIGGFRP